MVTYISEQMNSNNFTISWKTWDNSIELLSKNQEVLFCNQLIFRGYLLYKDHILAEIE